MRSKQATIWDIAVKLNVSISTVSRALRNAPDINPDTKRAVLDMARQLNYEPNTVATSLRKSKTNIIGVIVPEFVLAYFPTVILGIQDVANAAGYKVMIVQSNESVALEKQNLQALVASRVDGIALAITRETTDYEHIRAVQQRGIPVVFVGRIADELQGAKVLVDDYQGAFGVVEHLIEQGCRRIAHLAGPAKLTLSRNRLNGYRDALIRHGLPVEDDLICPCDFVDGRARFYTQRLIDSPNRPDALFAINDPTLMEALMCLKEAGLRIPEDMALTGFTNAPHATFVDPPLTAVVQPTFAMGQVAAQMLLRQIDEGGSFQPETQTLHTELVVRQSTNRRQFTPA